MLIPKKLTAMTLAVALSTPAMAFDSPRSWERFDGGKPSTTRIREALKKCEVEDAARRSRSYPGLIIDMKPIEDCMADFGYRLKKN
jgi:hypothetical protein